MKGDEASRFISDLLRFKLSRLDEESPARENICADCQLLGEIEPYIQR